MTLKALVGILALAGVARATNLLEFPPGFKFGAASSAYQIEGAWNVSDKGESIWDRIVHTRPHFIRDLSNGDVACDSYHLWEEDLKLIEDLGLDFYRFSISWARLVPGGFAHARAVSAAGARYYSALIRGLRARRVAPLVTLYHFDLPQPLQDLGGWANPLVVDWFADYARVVFSLFAGQVDTWITINEPGSVCDGGYGGILAPALNDYKIGALLCSKHILLAHARAYRIYEEEFKPQYGGAVSFSSQELWLEPKTEEDVELTLLARDYAFGRYTHPIYSAEGGWPPALERYMADKSEREEYPRSRLPAFTAEEIEMMKGSFDFFGLNHYSSRTVRATRAGERAALPELCAALGGRPRWPSAPSMWFPVNPEGLRSVLGLIKQQYGDVKVLITENGYPDSGELNDAARVQYYQDYLEQVLLAVHVDGVRVVGYTAWSLLDNFEWTAGYQSPFGLYSVDFSDGLRRRTAKASARYYGRVARARTLLRRPRAADLAHSVYDAPVSGNHDAA